MKNASTSKIVLLSGIGGALEFFDFAAYVFFAKYMATQFFQPNSSLMLLVNIFAIFAAGYLMRPLGGLIFSHFGDTIGRVKTWSASIFIMAFASMMIAFIPPASIIGVMAPISLIVCRLLQGFSLGSETPGAITYLCESLPKRKGLWTSLVFLCMNLGAMLAIAIHAIFVHFFTFHQIATWGWRAAFLFAGCIGLFGFWIRKSLRETLPAQVEDLDDRRMPLMELISREKAMLLRGVMIAATSTCAAAILYLYMPTYLATVLHYSNKVDSRLTITGLILYSISICIFGYLSDRFDRFKLTMVGAGICALLAVPVFYMLSIHTTHLVLIVCAFTLMAAVTMGCLPALLAELFKPPIRYSGIAFCYNISAAFFTGFAPLLASVLIKTTHLPWIPGIVLVLAGLLSFLASIAGKPKYRFF